MSEGTKTLTFTAAAVVVLVIAVASKPRPPMADVESPSGRVLNAVDDPLSATRLEIVEYVEDKAALRSFEVAYIDGQWVIPSHQDYPADAQQQMGDAATSVMNRKILSVASTNAGDHATYGVVEPKPDLTPGVQGVGMRVTMKNAQNENLVNMVVGLPVKDQEGQRYVREVGKDPVYIVDLDPSQLSTSFDKWIEKDLLKMTPSEVAAVELKDYSVELSVTPDGQPQILMDPRSEIQLKAGSDDPQSSWEVVKLEEFDPETKKLKQVETPEDEELQTAKLDDLKLALDDLQIVDVERKPEGLSGDLKAEESFANNVESLQSLAERGFYPVPVSRNNIELYSSEGEVNCTMKDGVEYVLRFGRITLGDQKQEGEEQDKQTGINRYLFVSARVNEAQIPKPELKELPPLPETPATEPAADAAPAAPTATEPAAAEPAATPDASETPADAPATEEQPATETSAEEQPATDAATEEKPADKEATEEKPVDAETEKVLAERKAIEAENQKKQEAYQQQLLQARQRAKDLNDRFGDWYYVISDDVYKKIHLGRGDIFAKKEAAAAEGDGLDALKALQQQGLGIPGVPGN